MHIYPQTDDLHPLNDSGFLFPTGVFMSRLLPIGPHCLHNCTTLPLPLGLNRLHLCAHLPTTCWLRAATSSQAALASTAAQPSSTCTRFLLHAAGVQRTLYLIKQLSTSTIFSQHIIVTVPVAVVHVNTQRATNSSKSNAQATGKQRSITTRQIRWHIRSFSTCDIVKSTPAQCAILAVEPDEQVPTPYSTLIKRCTAATVSQPIRQTRMKNKSLF
jgi:hypothetical protein